MAGVLSFALGLQNTQFSGAIDAAGGRLLAFLSTAQLVNKVMGAISFGGGLTDLANETGVAEGRLFQLQEAFIQVGASAENVPAFLKRMQMSLSGVDESGQDTRQMLSQMGLDMGKLGGMDATQQIQAIAGALNELSQEQARYAAQRIFGREGGSAALRIARDMGAFNQSLAKTSEAGIVIQRTAAQFDRIGDAIADAKGRLKGFWAGVAEGTAPAIEAALQWAGSFDMTRAGENIGQFISGVIQIFREGSFADLISQSIYAGFTAGFKMIRPLIGMLADSMFMLLGSVGVSFVSAIEWGVLRLQQIKGGDIAPSFDAVLTRNMSKATSAYSGMIGERRKDMSEAAAESFSTLKPIFERIENAAQRAFSGMGKARMETQIPSREIDMIASKMERRREQTDVTDFEKFGFIFGKGGPSPVADATRQTAANTRQMTIYLMAIQKAMNRLTGQTPEVAMP